MEWEAKCALGGKMWEGDDMKGCFSNVPKPWLSEGTSSSARLHRCMLPEEGEASRVLDVHRVDFFPRRSQIDLELCHYYESSSYCISHRKCRHIPIHIHSKDFRNYIPIGCIKHTLG